tara:strand:- start:57 stop:554 length:498 start_codon:yes stop_codon:yes gene_type:complete
MKKLIIIFFVIPNIVFASSMKMIGEIGKLSEVNKTIEIKMYDNYFEPKEIKIKKNETIRFLITNYGELVHEFNIATREMHLNHQDEMMKMMEYGILLGDKIDKQKMKELSKKDHSLAHSHKNSLLLEPNQSGELIWKFSKDIVLEAACNVPGHYDSGMITKIINF